MQSDDYVPGEKGWELDGADAEMNDVVISHPLTAPLVTFDLDLLAGEMIFHVRANGRLYEHRIKDVTPPESA